MAFREDSTGTYTFPSNSTGSTVDLGARNTYRYVNATNVYNKGKTDGTADVSFKSGNINIGSTAQTKTISTGAKPKFVELVKTNLNFCIIYNEKKSTTQYLGMSTASFSHRYANLGTGNQDFSFNVSNSNFSLTVTASGISFFGDSWEYWYLV